MGNNIPVFFIQDGIKFPDVVHAAKPHPDREIPQAQSAHDTFWDFVSLHTEATAHTLWNMSDRGIPRSYRMMEGFGVNTFRMVNAAGESSLVKFHWKPKLGVHSLVWEEAQIVNGMDPDYHRRDLADAIESGAYPEWELGIQAFPDTPDQTFEGIDLLDPTKMVPEELAPVQPIGLMTLDANPTNFFAETEQVAFHPGHLVPGIDVTDDPLLQARLFSYLDTQISRLGGPNFGQIPINRPQAEVNDMLRDGMHQTGVHPGVAPYRPNSLDGGCPFLAGADAAFVEVPVPMPESTKLRAAPRELRRPLLAGPTVLCEPEPGRAGARRGGLHVRAGQVLRAGDQGACTRGRREHRPGLCEQVATGLGLPAPAPSVAFDVAPTPSPALSQVGAEWPLDGRIIGIVADDESDLSEVADAVEMIGKNSMVPLVIGPHGGELGSGKGAVPVSRTFLTMRSVEFDAILVAAPASDPRVHVLLTEAFRHCKAIGGWAAGRGLLEAAGIPSEAPGIVIADDASALFDGITALMKSHRVWERQV